MKSTVLSVLAVVFALLLAGVGQADSAKQFQFVDEFGYPRTDVTYVYVYNGGTPTASTLYKYAGRNTAITNPMTPSSTATTLTTNDGSFSFYDNVENHDIVANVGGLQVKFEGISPQDTRLQVPKAVYPTFIQKKGSYIKFSTQPVECAQKSEAKRS